MAYIQSSPSRGLGMGQRIYAAWTNYRFSLQQKALYRKTSRQLGTLSDRQLDDIGVSRHEIDKAARDYLYLR